MASAPHRTFGRAGGMEEAKTPSLKVVLKPPAPHPGARSRGTRASAIPRCGHCHTCLHPHLKKSCLTNRDSVPRVTKKSKKEVEASAPTPNHGSYSPEPRFRKWKCDWLEQPTLLGTGQIKLKRWSGIEETRRDTERNQTNTYPKEELPKTKEDEENAPQPAGKIADATSLPSPAGGVQVEAATPSGYESNPQEPKSPEMSSGGPDKVYVCDQDGCGGRFADAGALKRHRAVHGERRFICHYEGCGKSFTERSKLKRHFVSHTGEKPFVCTYPGCNKAFSLDFNLRTHMRTHTGDSYHICPVPGCDKKYLHEYKLKNHMKNCHG